MITTAPSGREKKKKKKKVGEGGAIVFRGLPPPAWSLAVLTGVEGFRGDNPGPKEGGLSFFCESP